MPRKNTRTKKVKIIATVGPSSFNKSIIQKMDACGIDIFRVNMSHTKIESLKSIINRLRRWTSKEICIDTEGAQIRTGTFKNKSIEVRTHNLIELVPLNIKGDANKIPVSVNPLITFHIGDVLKIDFHSAIIQITKIEKRKVYGRVLGGGKIESNKGICLDRDVLLPGFTHKDIKSFKIAEEFGIKTIALSFTSSGEDVKKLRKYFDHKIAIISKIESVKGLNNLKSICKESNAILIDRGDLSREVPIEKISFAQRYIQKKAKEFSTPVYVATNLLESMVTNFKPTRAEIHDITSTMYSGVDGLVLAAETAIGKYPVESVRMIARIVSEMENNAPHLEDINYLCSVSPEIIIDPHGGELTQNFKRSLDRKMLKALPSITVDDDILSDIVNIAEGTFSPLTGFMGRKELLSVLDENKLLDGIPWTMPILLQIPKDVAKKMPSKGTIGIKRKEDGEYYAILEITEKSRITSMESTAKKWFGTKDSKHPGVTRFYNGGDYILGGQIFLVEKPYLMASNYRLTPSQTRGIFNDLGWHNIIAFFTRGLFHRGHELIQKEALKKINADAFFVSLLVDNKIPGDFSTEMAIKFYEILIKKKYFDPYGILLGTFNTYSRYCGPREAVFAAICGKNYGCNCFILSRDNAETDKYYSLEDFRKLFSKVDVSMNVLIFDPAYYCFKCKSVTMNCSHGKSNSKYLSDSIIRKSLTRGRSIPKYILRSSIAKEFSDLYLQSSQPP